MCRIRLAGEIPTGGRSSQHSWNEAAASAVYEIQAGRYAAAGDTQAACMFKRAAHLSLGSVKRWQNPAGDLQIVKNHFPPVDRWGYEVYSFYRRVVTTCAILHALLVVSPFNLDR